MKAKESTYGMVKKLLTEAVEIQKGFAGDDWIDKPDEVWMFAKALEGANVLQDISQAISFMYDEAHKYRREYKIWYAVGRPMPGDSQTKEAWSLFDQAVSQRNLDTTLYNLQKYGSIYEPDEPE